MEYPRNVKISHVIYSIVWQGEDWFTHTGACGLCDYTNKVINVYEGQCLTDTADSLMHEILHAIIYELSVPLTSGEEAVVRPVASAWTAVLFDNPQVAKFYNKLIKQARKDYEQIERIR